MEYPNQNLKSMLQKEADRHQRDDYLFGNTLELSAPERHLNPKMLFRQYGATVLSVIDDL
ncbi:MAG: hypothetical protein WCJ60_00675 [bacterium]